MGELLDIASARIKGEFETQPAVESSIRRTIGSAYQSLGLYDRAQPHFREAIALDSRTRGPRDRQTLRDVILLTSVLDDAARYAEAESLARQNLEDCTAALGADAPITLEAMYQLGTVLAHLGKREQAESALRQCAASQRRVNGAAASGHPAVHQCPGSAAARPGKAR